MRRFSLMAVLSALVAISCGKEPIKGGGDIHTDNSFEVDSEVLYNQDYMSESVRFSLKEGHEGEFSCSVSIDGKNVSSIIRIGSSATEFTSGDKVSLSSAYPTGKPAHGTSPGRSRYRLTHRNLQLRNMMPCLSRR